jgi:elongation factor Tu
MPSKATRVMVEAAGVQASPMPDTSLQYKLIAKHSGKCLDVIGGPGAVANGVRVQQYDYLGGDNQKWRLVPVEDGYYQLIAKHSGKCLDVIGGPGGVADGVGLQQYEYLKRPAQ